MLAVASWDPRVERRPEFAFGRIRPRRRPTRLGHMRVLGHSLGLLTMNYVGGSRWLVPTLIKKREVSSGYGARMSYGHVRVNRDSWDEDAPNWVERGREA